jgi:hypothetical protein
LRPAVLANGAAAGKCQQNMNGDILGFVVVLAFMGAVAALIFFVVL